MRSMLLMTALSVIVTVFISGCRPSSQPEETSETKGGHSHTHSHDGDDALVWVEENVEHDGFLMALGHHGEHLHSGMFVEPAIGITRDGEDVGDATVVNSLVLADGSNVIIEQNATIYEPKTEEEPAHYAQGPLYLPKGSEQVVVRFHIGLPGAEETITRDITIDLEP